MIIKKVHLENIRSHENTDVELTPGINVIMGNTGSGKSSILMAIEYALFGKTSDNDNKILLRRNAQMGKVGLEFEEEGKTILVNRGLRRVKDSVRNDDSENYIKVNNAPINLLNRNEDLNRYIAKLIKMESENPIKTFEALTYIKQDELKTLILNESSEKQKLIDSILQLNKYQDTYDYMRDLLNLISAKLEEGNKALLLLNIQEDIVKLEEQIALLSKEIEEAQNSLDIKQKEIGLLKEELKREEENNIRLLDKKLKHQELTTKLKELKRRSEEIDQKVKNVNAIIEELSKKEIKVPERPLNELTILQQEKERKLEEINNNISLLQSQISALEREKSLKDKEGESLKTSIENLEKEIRILQNSIEEIKRKLENPTLVYKEEINGRIAEINDFILTLKKEKELAMTSGICPICGSKADIEHLNKEYDKRIEEMQLLIRNYSEIKEDKKALEMELQRLSTKAEGQQANLVEFKKKLEQLNTEEVANAIRIKLEELNKLKNEEAKLREEMDAIREKIRIHLESERILREIDANRKLIEELLKQKASLEEESIKVSKEIEELSFEEAELNNSNIKLNELRAEEKKKESEISTLQKEIELKKEQVKRVEEQKSQFIEKMKEKKEYEEKIRKLNSLYQLLTNLREDIRGIREYVRLKFLRDFSQYFKEKFDELRKDREYDLEIDNNYNIRVIAGGSELSINALSGGEKTLASLAYRIALSIVASRLAAVKQSEVLIMDEPTVGLDREDLNTFINALTGLRGINQIIIVTHEELFKNVADTLIEVRKEGGKSKVQVIKGFLQT
jgi:exonuclease SbcC